MRFRNTPFIPLAATLCVAALTVCLTAPAAQAQQLILKDNQEYYAQNDKYQTGLIYVLDSAKLYVSNTLTTNGAVGLASGSGNGAINVFGGSVTTAIAGNTSTILLTNGTVGEARGNDASKINISGGTVTTLNGNASSTATISGGTVTTLNANNSSTATISGGNVIRAYGNDTSTTSITGGTVNTFYGYSTSTTTISGGGVGFAFGYNTSTTNITGGSVSIAAGNGSSTTNITSGSVTNASSRGSSTTNISGGIVGFAYGYNTSTTNISGGILTNGIALFNVTATANFIGTNLSFAYSGYGYNSNYRTYADFFKVSGTIGGVPNKTYDLYIRNTAGAGGTANMTQRQFTFSAPVVVPEAGSLALVLPALGMVGAMIVRRRCIMMT